jgi:transposase
LVHRYYQREVMMTKKDHLTNKAEKAVRDIRRTTRRHYSAEEKIRIVLEGLQGEESIAEVCRREGTNIYYRWSKEFLEEGAGILAERLRPFSDTFITNPTAENSARGNGQYRF